jgi:hypothetical protein
MVTRICTCACVYICTFTCVAFFSSSAIHAFCAKGHILFVYSVHISEAIVTAAPPRKRSLPAGPLREEREAGAAQAADGAARNEFPCTTRTHTHTSLSTRRVTEADFGASIKNDSGYAKGV